MVQRAALAVAKHFGEFEDARLARSQELLAGEFRRRPQIELPPRGIGFHQFGREGVQMGFVAGRNLQDGGLDLGEVARFEIVAQRRQHPPACLQKGPAVGVNVRPPPRRDRHRRAVTHRGG